MTETAVDYRPRGKGGPRKNKAQIDSEAVQAFEMRALGKSTWQIAQELGVSVQTACNRIEAARALITVPRVDAARELSMRTLEVARQKLLSDWALLLPEYVDLAGMNQKDRRKIEHSPKFAEALVKIEAQMDRLQGLARPVLIEAAVTVTHEGGIDGELAELAAQLGLNDPEPDQTPADDQQGASNEHG